MATTPPPLADRSLAHHGSDRPHRRVAVLAGVCAAVMGGALFVALAPATARTAQEKQTFAAVDARNDVRINRRAKGLDLAERRSIDLREVTVTPRVDSVRFTVRLREVLGGDPDFDQMVFINLNPPSTSTADWSGSLGFSPQQRTVAYAGLSLDASGTRFRSCDPLRATVLPRTNRVRLDVPNRCIPSGEAVLSVSALTGYFRSDQAGPWSSDRLKFPAPVTMR